VLNLPILHAGNAYFEEWKTLIECLFIEEIHNVIPLGIPIFFSLEGLKCP